MAGKIEEYQKYQRFYEEFHRRRRGGLAGGPAALPQKPPARNPKNARYLALTGFLLLLLLAIVLLYQREQHWRSFQLRTTGEALAGQTSTRPDGTAERHSDSEVALCREFNCRIYNSPWRRSFVTVDIYIKTDPDQRRQLDRLVTQQDRLIKDTLRDIISAADLYQLKDPQLTDIRSQIEQRLGVLFNADLSGRILIPRWTIRY